MGKKVQEYMLYFTTIPQFQPERFRHLTAGDRLKMGDFRASPFSERMGSGFHNEGAY